MSTHRSEAAARRSARRPVRAVHCTPWRPSEEDVEGGEGPHAQIDPADDRRSGNGPPEPAVTRDAAIVTQDEVADPHELDIKLTLSGEVMQAANTRDLIFRIPELIAYLSSIVPLESGDVISTGTPPGVGLGRTPQRWLKPDEDMVIEIEKLGTLRNRTRAIA